MCMVTFDWEENDAIRKFGAFHRTGSISWSVLEITDYCNFNCKWCFANASSIRQPVHMGLEDAKKIIGMLADAGTKQLTLSGGEPTLHPHLRDIVSFANGRGMVVHMNTNGYILTRKLASELRKAGLSQVQINIDSLDSGRHDSIRGRKGSFQRAVQALKNARAAGITCASQTVLTKDNENEIVEIFRFARSMGIQRCRVWDMTPSDGCARENSYMLPKNYLKSLQMLADFAYSTGARSVEIGEPMFIPHIRTKLDISGGYCVSAAGMIIYISTGGDVYFCCTTRKKMYNVFDVAGRDIRNVHREKVSEYLEAFELPEGCKACRHVQTCKGGCYTRREFSGRNSDYWCAKSN